MPQRSGNQLIRLAKAEEIGSKVHCSEGAEAINSILHSFLFAPISTTTKTAGSLVLFLQA